MRRKRYQWFFRDGAHLAVAQTWTHETPQSAEDCMPTSVPNAPWEELHGRDLVLLTVYERVWESQSREARKEDA